MTRILDVDLASGPPDAPSDQGRVFAIFWRDGAPVAAEFLPSERIREAYDRWIRDAEPVGSTSAAASRSASTVPAPLVSVVVSTRYRPGPLESCLAALERQEHPDREVIIVDNSDGDARTRALAASADTRVRYVVEPRPGLRFARNHGLREAAGEIVAFTDDDCRPVPGWLTAMARAFADPAVACCTGPVLPLRLDTPAQEWLELRGGFSRGYRFRRFRAAEFEGAGRRRLLQPWQFGTGGNMAFRRDFFAVHGGFDEVLPTGEDLEAFFRVLRSGNDIVYEPRAAVRHDHPAEMRTLRRRLYDWGWAYTAFLAKTGAENPDLRGEALAERRAWLDDMLSRRLLRREPRLPLDLVLEEIAGGLAGPAGYRRRRRRARP